MRLLDMVKPNALASYWAENPLNEVDNDPSLLFFPKKKVANTELEYYIGNKTAVAPLQPSAFDAIPRLRYRQGVQIQNAKMPFFREMMHLTEQEKIDLAKLQSKGDVFFNAMLDRIYDDADELRRAALINAKIMRYQLLNAIGGTPAVTIGAAAAPGQTDNVIFAQTYDPSGTYASSRYTAISDVTKKWNVPATATPLEDLQLIIDTLEAAGCDTSAITLLMNKTTFNALRACAEIKGAFLQGSNGNAITFPTDAMVIQVLSAMLGANVVVENGSYKGYDGNNHKYYADGYVTIIAGSQVLGSTAYGLTAEELDAQAIDDGNVAMYEGMFAIASKVEAGPPVKESLWVAQTVAPTYEGMWNTAVLKAF